jgi:hypothetical protein
MQWSSIYIQLSYHSVSTPSRFVQQLMADHSGCLFLAIVGFSSSYIESKAVKQATI